VALIGAPFAFGYTTNTTAFWSSVILGAVIALASAYKAYAKDVARWVGWVDIIAAYAIVYGVLLFVLGLQLRSLDQLFGGHGRMA
jgi:hypothetical protein